MKNKYILLSLILIWALSPLRAQHHVYTVCFDVTGKLLPPMPDRLADGDAIQFSVPTASKELKEVQENILTSVGKEKNLLQIEMAQGNLDNSYTQFDITKTDLQNVISQLDTIIKNPAQTGLIYAPGLTIKDIYIVKLNDTTTLDVNKWYVICNKYTDTTKLFADTEYIYHSTKKIPDLYTNFRHISEYYYFQANKVVYDSVKTWLKTHTIFLKEDMHRLNLTLVKENPYNKMVLDWIKNNDRYFEGSIPTELDWVKKGLIDGAAGFIDCFVGSNSSSGNSCTLASSENNNYSKYLQELIQINKTADSIKYWMLKMLWYTNGIPSLSPFSCLKSSPVDTTDLPDLREKLSLNNLLLSKVQLCNNCNGAYTPGAIIDTIEDETRKISERFNAAEKASVNKAKNDSLTAQSEIIYTPLNSFILYATSYKYKTAPEKNPVFYMRHHDGADNYQLMDDAYKKEYLENDKEFILANNLTKDQKPIATVTTTLITSDAPKLDAMIASANPPTVLEFQGTSKTLSFAEEIYFCNQFNSAKESIELLESWNSLYDKCIDNIKEKTEKDPAYRSQLLTSLQEDGPETVKYSISDNIPAVTKNTSSTQQANQTNSTATSTATGNNSSNATPNSTTTQPGSFTYRVDKLYHIWPMIGIAYSYTTFTTLQVNSAGTAPAHLVIANPATVFAGVKVYIRKTDIRSTRFFTDEDDNGRNLFLSRLSLNFAIAIPKPLNNMFGGVGIDLWPGLNINCGIQLNSYSNYLFSSTQYSVESDNYRCGFYIGIATDASVVNDLIKLFSSAK